MYFRGIPFLGKLDRRVDRGLGQVGTGHPPACGFLAVVQRQLCCGSTPARTSDDYARRSRGPTVGEPEGAGLAELRVSGVQEVTGCTGHVRSRFYYTISQPLVPFYNLCVCRVFARAAVPGAAGIFGGEI